MRDEKSHLGILGSKAACAYPRRYRGLPRPSSALKPSHSPDGVACRTVWWYLLAFGENLTLLCARVVAYAWCHFEFRCFGGSVHRFALHLSVQSCILSTMYPICRIVLQAKTANIRLPYPLIRVFNGILRRESFYFLTDYVVARCLDSSAR